MRKVVAVVAVVLGVGLGLWRCSRSDAPTQSSATVEHAQGSGKRAGASTSTERPLPNWFVTRGAPARKIAGRVTHAGAPVAGATVTLHSALTVARAAAPIVQRTGADGRFDFGLLPSAEYDVTALAAGLTPVIAHVALADPNAKPAPDQLELRLRDCSVFVEGTIYDASNNPLPKASVRMNGLVGVDADARGAYKLCVPMGDAEIDYSADGYGAVTLTIEARGEMHRDVVLVPEAAITVHVVRADNAQAVADAHVRVVPFQWEPERPAFHAGISDADGNVRIDGLVPGRYRVQGYADDLLAQIQPDVVATVGLVAEVQLRLDAMATIAGTIVNGTSPIAGVHVYAVRKSPMTRSPVATSQLDGSFVLDRVPAGDLVFQASPYQVVTPLQFKVEAGKRYDGIVIDVRPQGEIRGHVTRNGKPVEGVDVCCIATAQPSRAVSDRDGAYEFTGVPPGSYELGGGSDEAGAFTFGKKLTLAAGEQRVLDLELDMAGTIAGTVVDREGHPVKGVYVRWLHEATGDEGRSVTDSLGRYRCGAMTGGGVYRAAVYPAQNRDVPYPTADGAPYPTLAVKDGTTVIEGVKLAIDKPDLAISGQVVDDAGGPVVDAVVKALATPAGGPAQFHSWLRLPLTSTDADGTFTLRDLAPGSYALQARGADGAEGTTGPITAGAANAVIRIVRAGRIDGTLVGFSQSPVVYARPLGTYELIAGVVDGAAVGVTGLKPGRYLVNAMNGYEGDVQTVEVRPGQPAKVVLTSHGRATVDGTVLDFRTREPIANASCHVVMNIDGEQIDTNWDLGSAPKTDARGRVTLEPSPAGSLTVACEMPSFRRSRAATDVTATAGGRVAVQLLSVDRLTENSSTIGVELRWRTTPPRISSVRAGSPAAKAGILPGDLVTEVNGASVQGLDGNGVQFLIDDTLAGETVRITVLRGTAVKKFTAKAVAN